MKKRSIIFLLLFACFGVTAQTISIKDKNTNEPIINARLIRQQPKVYILTNDKGEADISSLAGAKRIEIFALGYKALVMSYDELVAQGTTLSMSSANYNLNKVVISANKWQQSQSEIEPKVLRRPAASLPPRVRSGGKLCGPLLFVTGAPEHVDLPASFGLGFGRDQPLVMQPCASAALVKGQGQGGGVAQV